MLDYSSESLLQFLDYAAEKGLMNRHTARTKKVAVSSIFEILDDNELSDIRNLDVNDVIQRFAHLEGEKFTPKSLKDYKSRLNSSVRDFIRYRDNPLAYSAAKPKINKLKSTNNKKLKVPPNIKRKLGKNKTSSTESVTTNNNTFESPIFPIPIRNGEIVRIAGLPHDLTEAEAKRITAVITALAISD